MTESDLLAAIQKTGDELRERGFAETLMLAVELSRLAANSNLAPRLMAEWLRRSPEGMVYLLAELDKLGANRTRPATDAARSVDLRSFFPNAAQSSEPRENESEVRREPGPMPGRKGAESPPLVVTLGNVGDIIGRSSFETRRVKPGDVNELGDVPGFIGQAAVNGLDGTPLTARAKFRTGVRIVEFLDKRGPLLMMRIADGSKEKGMIVTGDIRFIEPGKRAEVLAALGGLPDANSEFNFSPYDDVPDAWLPAETEEEPPERMERDHS